MKSFKGDSQFSDRYTIDGSNQKPPHLVGLSCVDKLSFDGINRKQYNITIGQEQSSALIIGNGIQMGPDGKFYANIQNNYGNESSTVVTDASRGLRSESSENCNLNIGRLQKLEEQKQSIVVGQTIQNTGKKIISGHLAPSIKREAGAEELQLCERKLISTKVPVRVDQSKEESRKSKLMQASHIVKTTNGTLEAMYNLENTVDLTRVGSRGVNSRPTDWPDQSPSSISEPSQNNRYIQSQPDDPRSNNKHHYSQSLMNQHSGSVLEGVKSKVKLFPTTDTSSRQLMQSQAKQVNHMVRSSEYVDSRLFQQQETGKFGSPAMRSKNDIVSCLTSVVHRQSGVFHASDTVVKRETGNEFKELQAMQPVCQTQFQNTPINDQNRLIGFKQQAAINETRKQTQSFRQEYFPENRAVKVDLPQPICQARHQEIAAIVRLPSQLHQGLNDQTTADLTRQTSQISTIINPSKTSKRHPSVHIQTGAQIVDQNLQEGLNGQSLNPAPINDEEERIRQLLNQEYKERLSQQLQQANFDWINRMETKRSNQPLEQNNFVTINDLKSQKQQQQKSFTLPESLNAQVCSPSPGSFMLPTAYVNQPIIFDKKDPKNRINMNESHVRRARLTLDKKKKQFEQQPNRQKQAFQAQVNKIVFDGLMFESPKSPQPDVNFGKGLPGFLCVPNITYKSILPGTNRTTKHYINTQPQVYQHSQLSQKKKSFTSLHQWPNQKTSSVIGALHIVNIQHTAKKQLHNQESQLFGKDDVSQKSSPNRDPCLTNFVNDYLHEDAMPQFPNINSQSASSSPSNFHFTRPGNTNRLASGITGGLIKTLTKKELEELGFSATQLSMININQIQASERLQLQVGESNSIDAKTVANQMVQDDLAHRSLSALMVTNQITEATKRGLNDTVSKPKAQNDQSRTSKFEQGTPSTKPASSSTNLSASRITLVSAKKDQDILKPQKLLEKTQSNGKRRIQIYFKDNTTEMYRNHKINKAINLINHIIRLIFKNNKDSQALTATNISSMAPNSLLDVTRINEIQKIAKQINIVIPRRFDSKASLREFFYSRDFILTVKIKMNNLLHKAILSSNHIPQSLVEQSMCENGVQLSKKYWVGHGNNSGLIKSVLKQRYWWQNASEESFESDCDFIWTAWKKNKHIEFLAKAFDEHKSKLDKQPKTEEEDIQQKGAKGKKKENILLPMRLYNRLEQNKQLTNKKGLFINMRRYYEMLGQDPFTVLPLTFHTLHGINDPDFKKFKDYYTALERSIKQKEAERKKAIKAIKDQRKKRKSEKNDESSENSDEEDKELEAIKQKYKTPKNTWIVKPGENTNCGQGINVVKDIQEVMSLISTGKGSSERTYIIQKYIDYPLLVHKRKFDFRCYGMLTSIGGSLKGFAYHDGYVRTSCREFNLDDVTDQYIHLTNDAIQKHAEDYGKFENANKISFSDFSKVICNQQPDLDFDMYRDLMPQIHKLMADTFKAAFTKIDPARLQNTFELFGYDFMVDENFKLYLIEVNTNPCLEICCPLLARIIPEVIDNCFRTTLDVLFPSPDLSHNRKFQLNELPQEVKFTLVFDEDVEGEALRKTMVSAKGSIREENENIESDKECDSNESENDD